MCDKMCIRDRNCAVIGMAEALINISQVAESSAVAAVFDKQFEVVE